MRPTPTYAIPAEHLTVGLIIFWNGESGSIEDITDQPDDESVYVEICFDGARTDEGFSIPYGTEVGLVHARQAIEALKAMAVKKAAEHAEALSIEANKQPLGRVA